MDDLEKLKNAKTIEQRVELAIEELYKIIESVDNADKIIIKRYLMYLIGLLQGIYV